MSKINFKEQIYLKSKESTIVSILLILAIILFIIPILSIALLRFLFKLFEKIQKNAAVPVQLDSPLSADSIL